MVTALSFRVSATMSLQSYVLRAIPNQDESGGMLDLFVFIALSDAKPLRTFAGNALQHNSLNLNQFKVKLCGKYRF
jgi:hypothetical protein